MYQKVFDYFKNITKSGDVKNIEQTLANIFKSDLVPAMTIVRELEKEQKVVRLENKKWRLK